MALLAGGGSAQLVRDVGSAGSVQGFRADGELAGARLSSALPFLAGLQAQDGIAQVTQGVAGIVGNLAATEFGNDTAESNGIVLVSGNVAAIESQSDSIEISGQVIVSGGMVATESATDTATIIGSTASVNGNLVATEATNDSLSSTGTVLVKGVVAATETVLDSLSSTGTVLIKGSLVAQETGNDQSLLQGFVSTSGVLFAAEFGVDTAVLSGVLPVQGVLAGQEPDSDTFTAFGSLPIVGGVSAIEEGVDSFSATGSAFVYFITKQQAMLLMQIHSLHGLASGSPLVVNTTSRSSGSLTQTISQSGGIITIETIAAPGVLGNDPGVLIDELAAIHGLTSPLVVSSSSRTANGINQTINMSGETTTVTRS